MNGFWEELRITRRRVVELLLGCAGLLLSGFSSARKAGAKRSDPAAALRQTIEGSVTARGDEGFEAARGSMVWNARKPDRRPDLIVQARSVSDVQEAVRFARRRRLKVSVRGGGHHLNGTALREGGVMIDLGALRELTVDAANRTAIAQPGARSQEMTAELAEHRLAFPSGHCPTVALSGYLLGGGFGWNAGEWGVACWNVTGVDVVTPDGALVHANGTDHPDLFWAARGAGPGFFGVIVGYHLRLFDLPTAIHTTTLLYPLDKAGDLGRWAARTRPNLPRNVELLLLCMSAPPPLMERHRRVCMATATAFARSREEAAAALEGVASCPVEGALAKDPNTATTFDGLFGMMDAAFPAGKRYAADMLWLSSDAGAVLGRAAGQYELAPSPRSLLLCILPPPPPPDAPPPPDCAFSMVGPVCLGCYAIWDDPSADAENTAWLRRTTDDLSSATIGYYIGETDVDAGESRSRRSFSPANWQRLADLRKKHDPARLFHAYPGDGQG